MADPTKAAAQAVTTDAELSLLDQIVEQGKLGKDAEAKSKGKDLVKRFVSEVLEGAITINRDTETMINARIAQIDHLLSLQLNEILHHPEFQKLEGSWRGLQYLLKQSETGTMLKIKVLNVSKKDLLRDLQRAPEFDQSALFKKVYEEEYGVFGGTPFGALVGDYYFDKSGQDIELLEKVSQVAAAAHAPFISAASHEMLNLETWADLDTPRDLAKIFDSTEYAKWKGFRNSEDSRYVALTAPRVLAREPYGSATVPIEAFNYEERVDGTNHDHYCWTNAAYSMAANINKAFALYGWCASIRGVESGGLVEGLPVHNFRTESGEIAMKCPTEVQITDRREKELADLGFAPLVHQKGTDNAAFFSVQSAQKAKVYDDPKASASARMSAQLPYIFATSRFAHYLKVMMRDKIGGYTSRSQIDAFLNKWIQNYVAPTDAPGMVKAKRPLSEARIDVVEVAGKPGVFRAVAFLKPHYQLDELAVSMRLVAELPPPAA
ncbi:MAG: type VI secretion system contractile sheath large subunit [Gemmatimonas sp.]|jgi:type VI secretion system protein ImpC|uniref:type VI secretion system contractile sheath large subunit n=1 Tax=Gemmatimonas sp. TaxID=1962908 RepID=UPI00391F34F4|nr:type VI secretion system contractile sheath large subunit [Gemmatimonadota bacterium]